MQGCFTVNVGHVRHFRIYAGALPEHAEQPENGKDSWTVAVLTSCLESGFLPLSLGRVLRKKVLRRAELLRWSVADADPGQHLIVCRKNTPDKLYPSPDFRPGLLG